MVAPSSQMLWYPLCSKYLHSKRVPWNKQVCERAAFWGKEDSLCYAREHGCPWDGRTCEASAKGDELVFLRYAHKHGCHWDARTVNAAAEYGQYRCLEYALAHNCPADHTACTRAAAGNLACLVIAHEQGCSWNSSTCTAAAKAGKLECLQYLFEHECSWDAATTHAAMVAGTLDCLKYAHEHGCPWVVAQLLAIPLTVKSRRCLEYVREQTPAEAAAYDASILARQKSHEEERFAFRNYVTSQLSKVLNEATWARGGFSVESQENKSLFAPIGTDALPALASLLLKNRCARRPSACWGTVYDQLHPPAGAVLHRPHCH
jgi:hypothetical protein